MPLDGDYAPGTSKWARDQAERYEASGGTESATIGGRPIVVITSRGAKSGHLRKTALMRVEDGGRYLAVASAGGGRRNPRWVHNLREHPFVELQDGAKRGDYTVRELEGAERETWWTIAVAAFPTYATYQRKAPRRIPLFLLELAERA